MSAASYFENMSPAQKIFNWTFPVSIPQMHIYSERELEIYGNISTGDSSYDRALANEPVKMSGVTIARMLEWWKNGLQNEIVLLNPAKDAPTIYNILRDAISSWYLEVSKDPLHPEVPLEELKIMDEFAQAVYEKAKYHFVKDGSNLNFLDQMHLDSISPLAEVEEHFKKIQNTVSSAPYHSVFKDIVSIIDNAKRNWRQ